MRLALPSTIRALSLVVITATAGCPEAPPDDLADGQRPQLLVNPDFEDGEGGPALWGYLPPLGWVAVGNSVAVEASRENIFEAASGELAALVGGGSALVQVVDLPADATGVRLRGLHCLIGDVNTEVARDFCDVHGEIDGERNLFFRTSNLDGSNPRPCQWEPFSVSGTVTPGATLHLMLMSLDSNLCLYDRLELVATYE